MPDPIIELVNISKSYNGTEALKGINLYIRRNEFLTMLGPSGCGKTTTLRIIGGFEHPLTGKVLFEGKDITSLPPYKRKVNTVFQKYALLPHMNVEENIAFGLKIKKLDKDTIKTYAAKCKNVITLEEHSVIGGLGDAVAEVLLEEGGYRIKKLGVQDEFGQSGTPEELLKEYRLDPESVYQDIIKFLK